MTQTESDIIKDAWNFLKEHSNPPSFGTAASDAFWHKTAGDLAEAGERWKNHPLALEIFPAVYSYIEAKQKRKEG